MTIKEQFKQLIQQYTQPLTKETYIQILIEGDKILTNLGIEGDIIINTNTTTDTTTKITLRIIIKDIDIEINNHTENQKP